MGNMRDFRSLKVWQAAHELTLDVYRVTKQYPREEQYGLTSQTRQSSGSIATNIAEGCGRGSGRDFARFLKIAAGSACELDYQLLLARDLGYLSTDDHVRLFDRVTQVQKMLRALIDRIESDQSDVDARF